MHFITGGAFNGKRNWALTHYGVNREEVNLISSFGIAQFSQSTSHFLNTAPLHFLERIESFQSLTIIEGLEYFIRASLSLDSPRQYWRSTFEDLKTWEKAERKIVIIGSDITKGIVPLKKEEREWRDFVGFCYQDLVGYCDRVDVVWYGLNQRLK